MENKIKFTRTIELKSEYGKNVFVFKNVSKHINGNISKICSAIVQWIVENQETDRWLTKQEPLWLLHKKWKIVPINSDNQLWQYLDKGSKTAGGKEKKNEKCFSNQYKSNNAGGNWLVFKSDQNKGAVTHFGPFGQQKGFLEMYKECSDTFKNDHELKELFDLSVNMNNLKIKEREAILKNKLRNCYIG